ncbi:carbohydrate ABC transporter permease, partial [Streptomyces coelicoflavus]|nr:carbohydrate ABC transporter permease [Streptomyces coelicoflavus]
MTTQSLPARTDAPARTPAVKASGRGGRRLLR